MGFIGIAFTAVSAVIHLAVYIGMLGVANTPFQEVAIGGLGIIYSIMAFNSMNDVKARLGLMIYMSGKAAQAIHIIERATEVDLSQELGYQESEAQELTEKLDIRGAVYYINIAMISLIWLASVLVILFAIL